MNRLRILGGFSLVEMMLILLITSLMLASGVAVVSKKHVKVPKIAVHGSYMCYYKNGRLHEEQYVGAGLNKKIVDRNTNRCEFTPPDRAGYLYIQATAGGGGGGDAGYKGGNLQLFQSATEVITPFGLTQGILDLKGISSGELTSLGGQIYAYANATGGKSTRNPRGGNSLTKPGGDAGNGGDVYYIKQDASGICLKYREWEYQGNEEIGWSCSKCKSKNYTHYYYNYHAWDDCCEGGWTRCSYEEAYDCRKWDPYWEEYYWGTCYRTKYYDCYDSCLRTYSCHHTYGSCDAYSLPTSWVTDVNKNLKVYAEDTYTFDYTKYNKKPGPMHVYEESAATGTDTKQERQVIRDENTTYSICNYGNPNKFSGVSNGVFGAFAGYDGTGVSCSTSSIMKAFGDDIFPMGGGSTSLSRITQKASSSVYTKKIEYDKSEEDDTAYGTRCSSDARPGYRISTNMPKSINDCGKNIGPIVIPQGSNDTWSPISAFRHNPVKSLVVNYKVTVSSSYYSSCPTGYDHISKSTYSTSSQSEPIYDRSCCTTWQKNSSGTECLYTYTPSAQYASYFPERASGGSGGTGRKCRTNNVNAGLGVTFTSNSDVIAGIRGSDKNCTGAGYQSMYTYANWKAQPGKCYAENGTDSQGSAMVNLNGYTCTVNVLPPTQGQGARKVNSGGTAATAGKSAPVSSGGRSQGTYSLSGATLGGGGCDTQHVGYCVKGRSNYKYKYRYTWNTNYLQYGEGGKAGGYNVKLIRSVKDGTYVISPGRGGAGAAVGTGNTGDSGENTVVQFMPADGSAGQQVLFVPGGAGGPGGLVTPTEQLPTWYSGGNFTKGQNGTPGETLSVANMKSNLMNVVLPVGDNNVLNQWLLSSAAGGDGGGSRNYCWASEWQRWFEGTRVKGNLGMYLDENDMRTYACRNGTYWSSTPAAQDGIAGVVIIRW